MSSDIRRLMGIFLKIQKNLWAGCFGKHPAHKYTLIQLLRHSHHHRVQSVTYPLHGLAHSGFPALGTETDNHLCGETYHNPGGHAPEKRIFTHLHFTPLFAGIVSPICREKTPERLPNFSAWRIISTNKQDREGRHFVKKLSPLDFCNQSE